MNHTSWGSTGTSGILDVEDSPDFLQEHTVNPLPAGYSYTVGDILTQPTQRNDTFLEPNYSRLASEHAERLREGASAEEIVSWTGDKLGIMSWKQKKFHGEMGALSTPETPEGQARFQKFVEALGVTHAHDKGIEYAHANGPSKTQPQYFLLDGFVQNAWLGEKNMLKVDEKLKEIKKYFKSPRVDTAVRVQYLHKIIGIGGELNKSTNGLNIGYRFPLKSSGYDEGIWIGGSFYKNEEGAITKMVNILGITGERLDYYENTAATGRLCLVG